MLIGSSYNMLILKLLAFLFVVILSSSLGVKGKGLCGKGKLKMLHPFPNVNLYYHENIPRESKTVLMNEVMNLFIHVFRKENPYMIANFMGPGIEFQGSN